VAGDGVGWPDLVMLRGDRIVVAELKADGAPGPRPEQRAWLDAWRAVGAEVYVWRPADFGALHEVLR
jgi:hypothetical protein